MQPGSVSVPFLSIVIPCYNEADRLHYLVAAMEEFDDRWDKSYELILVNDGSRDGTGRALIETREKLTPTEACIKILSFEENQGKGYALKKGVEEARGQWILTLDADMSTHPSQLLEWNKDRGFPKPDVVYIGSRVHREADISARWYRVILGNLFNAAIQMLTGVREGDTQCGFKLYPAGIAKPLFQQLQTRGWAHDIELLMRLNKLGVGVVSLPVHWQHREGGSIRVFRDGVGMFFQVVRLSWKMGREGAGIKR